MADDKDQAELDPKLLSRFNVVRLLGRGAYGIVWKVVERGSSKVLALKRCFGAFQNSTDAQRTFREIIFLQELNGHENIVRLVDVFKSQKQQDLYVLFEYMETDLQQAIVKQLIKQIHVEYITYQILKALKYIHSGGVLHRDLKPANVLLNANCHARLCDFGLARTACSWGDNSLEAQPLFTDYVATRWYRAPELLLGAVIYSDAVDLWSLGCILAEMMAGKPILRGRSTVEQLEKVLEVTGSPSEPDLRPILASSPYAGKILESLPPRSEAPKPPLFLLRATPEANLLTLSLLKFNPERRPSAEKALEHPFVEKFHMQEAELTCDKLIRMPIPDTTKLKAVDYRNQILELIQQRLRSARDDQIARFQGQWWEPDRGGEGWSHEGGAAAPPCTPREL